MSGRSRPTFGKRPTSARRRVARGLVIVLALVAAVVLVWVLLGEAVSVAAAVTTVSC